MCWLSFRAMEPVIDVVAVCEVDRLKPPRGQLLVHHSRVVGYLAALGAVRSPEDSWLVRRRDYLEWLQEPLARALFARDREGLRGYAAVRVLEAQGRAGTEGAVRFYQREGAVDFERRRSRPSPGISGSRTRDPAVAPRSGRPQFRASMRRPASSRCSPTGDDSPTPPRGERAGRRHSAGASSLLPPDPPPLIPERTGMPSPLDPPTTVRCARRPAVHRDRDRDCHDRQEARAECPLWPAAHPAIGALHANGVQVRPVSLRRRSYLRLP
jgi:hypothetical protein